MKKIFRDNIFINRIYDNINPSILKIHNKKKFIKNREFFFKFHLKLDNSFFRDKQVLDLGCGSGYNTLFFLKRGAKCTLVDNNFKSLENAKKVLKKYKKNCTFIHNDIRKLKLKKKFDVLHSKGVFHHSYNQKPMLKKVFPYLKKGGIFIYANASTNDNFLRNFQKYVLYKISKKNLDIFANAKYLFKNHLIRANKFGLRSINSIINDTYINEIYNTLSSKEIIKIFEKNNFLLYSSFPQIITLNDILNPKITYPKNNLDLKKYKIAKEFIINDLYFIKKQTHLSIKHKRKFKNIEKSILKFTNLFNKLKKSKSILSNSIKKKFLLLEKNFQNELINNRQLSSFTDEKKNILKIIEELNKKNINRKKIKTLCSEVFNQDNGSGMNHYVFINNAL